MLKRFTCLGVLALTALFTVQSEAGLINYDRKKKTAGTTETAAKAAPADNKTRSSYSANSNDVKVSNRVERRYDSNRDGMLQDSEVKTFLKDVASIIKSRGGYAVDSDVLKKYDSNNDGIISRYESSKLNRDAR